MLRQHICGPVAAKLSEKPGLKSLSLELSLTGQHGAPRIANSITTGAQ